MPNTKEIPSIKRNIICYGPTGTGKSTIFTTLPGKKFAYIFDPGTFVALKGQDIDYEYFPPDGILGIRATQKGIKGKPILDKPKSWLNFEAHLEEFGTAQYGDYDLIGFLSITTLSQICLNQLLQINGRFGHVPEISDYNLLGITLVATLEAILSVQNKTVFVEGHSDLVQDEVSKRVENQFDVTKNVRRMLPRLFTDVWVSSANVDNQGKPGYKIQTMPTPQFPLCKNSLGLPPFLDVTIRQSLSRIGQGVGKFIKKGEQD